MITWKPFLPFLLAAFLVLLGGSCREVFYPNDIESDQQIPVIQGFIVNGQVPSVSLSWAIGYYANTTTTISGAHVTVTDDLGHVQDLPEVAPGTYTATYGTLYGTVGREYTLHVILPDGSEYESLPERMRPAPVVDSLFAKPEKKTVYSYNSDNILVGETQQGLTVKSALSAQTDTTVYVRFNTPVLKESTYTLWPGTIASIPAYIWSTTTLDNLYSVAYSVKSGNRQVIPDHEIGFLNYFYDSNRETPDSTAPFTVGWVLTFTAYSISPDVYAYYNSMASQLNANEQIFAPVPSQVKSNISCISSPDKPVIGVFEANSYVKAYQAFGWNSLSRYLSKKLDSFSPGKRGGYTRIYPPSFWITFD